MGITICVVGCGGIANSVHGPSYLRYQKENPDAFFAACCDVSEERARAFREKFGFARHYTDYAAMLERERPDAVCLIAPEDLQAGLACDILSRGFPVMLEKPPGKTRDEALAIERAARDAGVGNQVAFNRRFLPMMRALAHRLETAPPIQAVRYDFFRVGRRDRDFSDTAIHGIDAVRFLTGSDYRRVDFFYQYLPGEPENVANVTLQCAMESGATAQLNFFPLSGVVIERAAVNCLDHTFFLDIPIWSGIDAPGRLLHLAKDAVVEDLSGSEASDGPGMFEQSGFYAENKVFFDDIAAGRLPKNHVGTCVQSVEVAECIRRRRPVYEK